MHQRNLMFRNYRINSLRRADMQFEVGIMAAKDQKLLKQEGWNAFKLPFAQLYLLGNILWIGGTSMMDVKTEASKELNALL